MAQPQEHTPPVIPMEGSIIHRDAHLLYTDPICPSQEDQEQQDTPPALCAPRSSSLPDLSTLSTLWVPLHEVRQAWADFGKEALTTSALMATGAAFGGLYWETHALQHSTWATDERERGHRGRVVFWLSRAVQDLDCSLDQWQQAQRMLDLAAGRQRPPAAGPGES